MVDVLPDNHERATLVGRIWDPQKKGPSLVAVRGDELVDLTPHGPTMSDLLERQNLLELVRTAEGQRWPVSQVLDAPAADDTRPHLLAPIDLQVIKAAGVTFAKSMIERVIDERAGGDATRADEVRQRVMGIVGEAITGLQPGSDEAEKIKQVLIEEQLWSQYL